MGIETYYKNLTSVRIAANMSTENHNRYLCSDFLASYPQFCKKTEKTESDVDVLCKILIVGNSVYTSWLPEKILADLVDLANSTIQEDRWGQKWIYACGLLVAHGATLYLRNYKDGTDNIKEAANSGSVIGNVSSASLGDANVSFDSSFIQNLDYGTYNQTSYGITLLTESKTVGLGGMFVGAR